MTAFDPMRALREELQGLREVEAAIMAQVRRAEAKAGEAEIELNSIRKVHGYLRMEMARKQEVLRELMEQGIEY